MKSLTRPLRSLRLAMMALVLACFAVPVFGQLGGSSIGTSHDTYIVNDDYTNFESSLRLQTNNDYAWNVVNDGNQLYWSHDVTTNFKSQGILRMVLDENGDFGVLSNGSFALGGSNKWIRLAEKPTIGSSPAAYGQRIQWGDDFATFSLRENGPQKDLVVQYGSSVAGSPNDLRFEYFNGTAPHDRMILTDDGKLGLRTTTPEAFLHIQDNEADPGIRLLQVGDDTYFTDIDSVNIIGLVGIASPDRAGIQLGQNGVQIWGVGQNFGIGIKTPQAKLHVNGAARFEGSIIPQSTDVHSLGSSLNKWHTVWAVNGAIHTSDRREKENIDALTYGLDEILSLRPVSYTWTKRPFEGQQVGLIAQEANEIIPEVVWTPEENFEMDEDGQWVPVEVTEDSRMGINYALLTPVLIRAIQEQQVQIEALQAQLAGQGGSSTKVQEDFLGDVALPKLYQNVPNPFDGVTEIRYYLPETVQQATLRIYDMTGQPVQRIALDERGEGTYRLDGSLLAEGMYLYALMADGQEIEVKRMVVTGQR